MVQITARAHRQTFGDPPHRHRRLRPQARRQSRWALRTPHLPRAFLRRTAPPSGSGTGPEQALEAIKPSPRALRESSPSSELPCARRTGPAEPYPIAHPKTASLRGPQAIPKNKQECPLLCKLVGPTPQLTDRCFVGAHPALSLHPCSPVPAQSLPSRP
jgi:hypothetical protein